MCISVIDVSQIHTVPTQTPSLFNVHVYTPPPGSLMLGIYQVFTVYVVKYAVYVTLW